MLIELTTKDVYTLFDLGVFLEALETKKIGLDRQIKTVVKSYAELIRNIEPKHRVLWWTGDDLYKFFHAFDFLNLMGDEDFKFKNPHLHEFTSGLYRRVMDLMGEKNLIRLFVEHNLKMEDEMTQLTGEDL
jgi:hypothetical protein